MEKDIARGSTINGGNRGWLLMNWEQIKTLLILSFLILNIYLFVQFLDKKEREDIGVLEQEQSSIEEQLATESIKYNELPDEDNEETFISVEQKMFTSNRIDSINKKYKQHPFLINEYFLLSKLDEKLKVNHQVDIEELKDVFSELVLSPDEYSYWHWNEQLNVIIFFQKQMDRPIYFNQNGMVLLFLNDNDELMYYTQTMLGKAEALSEKRDLIKPLQAIETLYKRNELKQGDYITSVNIGFHSRVPYEGGVHVFAPIWKVNVNNKKDYFVNAIEGFIFSTTEEQFLVETIEATLERLENLKDKDKDLQLIEEDLEKRIDHINRSE